MKGTIAAFVVVDLPRTVTLHAKAERKLSQASKDVQLLMQSDCSLIGVSRPDGRFQLCLQFGSVLDCLRAVGSYARSRQNSGSKAVPVHIGISVGELRDETPDIEFSAIKRARWLTTLTTQSAVLISESAAAIAQDQELIPYAVEEFGEFFNIQTGQTQRVFSLAHPQLAPLSRIEDDQPRHNIPWLTDFFIGREADIETVGAMLEHARYVRLIGPSGVGKSTLAKRVGLELSEQYRDGVKYVDLSQVTDRSGLLTQVLRSVDSSASKEASLTLEVIRRHFGGRHHLLILDGGDEVETHVEALVNSLLQTRRVQILSTTINASESQHGVEYLVEDMAVPQLVGKLDIKEIEAIDACAVFLDGMRKYRQGLPPQDSEASTILDLCRKTGGSPLALNLTARRLKFESLERIVEGYETDAQRPRLQSAVKRTLDQLSPSARHLIECASAFQGSWTKATLAALMDKAPSALTDDLQSLQYLGLIKAAPEETQFIVANHFKDGIRAGQKLRGELEAMRERHLLTILGLFRKSIQEINGPDQRKHLDSLHKVSDELEAALRYLIDSRPSIEDFIEAMRSLWPYWYKRNRLRTIVNLCDLALETCGLEDANQSKLISMLKAIFLTKFGHADRAIEVLGPIVDGIDENDDPTFTCKLLVNLGIAQWAEARFENALASHMRASEIAQSLGDPFILLSSYGGAASACICLERFDEAERWQVLVRQIAKLSDDRIDAWNLSMGEAQLAWGFGDYSRASQELTKCLQEAVDIGDSSLTSRTHLWRAQVEVSKGDLETAAISLGSCISTMDVDEHSLYRTNLLRIQEIERIIASQQGTTFLNQFKLVGSLTTNIWL